MSDLAILVQEVKGQLKKLNELTELASFKGDIEVLETLYENLEELMARADYCLWAGRE